MRKVIVPYKQGSASARALRDATGARIALPLVRTRFRPRATDVAINWGSSEYARFAQFDLVLNRPEAVRSAGDKLVSMRVFQDNHVPCPEFTTDRAVANQWLVDGTPVVCRQMLRASGGRGIVMMLGGVEGGVGVPNAPLYTKYVKKRDEYRVHVWQGEVIHCQQKRRRRRESEEQYPANQYVRNLEGGWVFCTEGVSPPEAVLQAARDAVFALGLDFGAADIGWNEHYQRPTVYEVNTAPGLEGTTLQKYAAKVAAIGG